MTKTAVSPSQRRMALSLELLLLSALVLFTWYCAHSALMREQPRVISFAIAFDLTLTAALCHWLLGVRVAGLATWTIVPVMLVGSLICRAILPEGVADTKLLPLATIALAETCAIGLGLLRARTIIGAYRAAKAQGAETFDAVETGFLAIMPTLPRVAAWARLEVQLWSLCFVGWSFKRQPEAGPNVFTHHKEANWFAILGVVLFLLISEAGVAHILLHSLGHNTAKWIVLALHSYGLVWLLGELQATRIYRSALRQKNGRMVLQVRVGLRGSSEIALDNIANVEVGSWPKAEAGEPMLALQGSANVKLSFKRSQTVKELLSAPRQAHCLLLHVDDASTFQAALAAAPG